MPQEQMISKQIIHTSSVIRLQIPAQIQNQPYAVQWISEPNPKFNHNYILTRFDANKTGRTNQFQCTPLDYGSIVVARLLVPKDNHPAVLFQERFGPIAVEKQITQQFSCQQVMDVKIILNKSITLKGAIKISAPPKGSPTNQKANIILQAPNFKFDIRMDQSIRLPSNNSFFKFYDKEEDCLGISIYHQHSELVEVMKDDKSVQLFGFYIKICFKHRLLRDIFLFRLIMKLGISIEECLPPELQQKKYTVNVKPSPKASNAGQGLLKVVHKQQKSQKSVRKQSKIKQVDDEILKLLDDQEEADNQYSLDMADAQLLLSSAKNVQIGHKTPMKISDLQKKHNSKETFLKQINQNTLVENNMKQQAGNNNEEDMSVKSKSNQSKISNNLLTPDQNYFRSTILKLTNQVKMLRKQNRRLVHQNKKLKDENMRLRFKQIKNTSLSRVYQIKNYDRLDVTNERSTITPFTHQKRQSIYQFNTENRHCTTKSNFTQDNFNEVVIKQKPKIIIKQVPQLASSSGSILMGSSQVKNTEKTERPHLSYHQHLNTSSVKDLSKQAQIPEERVATQKLNYHRSQQLMRRLHPMDRRLDYGLNQKQSYIKSSLNAGKPPNFGNSSIQFVNSTVFPSGK